jgi:hypothetical protein
LICNKFYSLHEFFNQCDWLTSLFFLGSVILDIVCVCVYIDDVFVFFLVLCNFIALYFYNGWNIIVKFLLDFIMWCICYLQTSPVPLKRVCFMFFVYKCFQMWYIVLLTTDKSNCT